LALQKAWEGIQLHPRRIYVDGTCSTV
jgi:hypothetical protein